ncbi:hypothetical protein VULLAG_LOCUS4733 [Vulpes lagopus]
MPAAECKPMHVVVTLLIHCPDLEEPSAPLDAPEEDQALGPAIQVQEVLEQSPDSVEQPASATEQHPEPPQEPTQALTSGPAAAHGPELFEQAQQLVLSTWPEPRCQLLSRSQFTRESHCCADSLS